MPADSVRPSPRVSLTLVAFFLSGFAALLYQVVWQRWLVFFTGISSASISLIVAVFMAGLGVGYLAGGALADRQRAPRPLLFFVLAELGIATFGIFSKAILYDGLYGGGLVRSTDPVMTGLVLLLVLFVPTFLMGLSLPLLAKSVTLESMEHQAGFVGRLYFVNTLGASFGAVSTGLLLVPSMGFHHATYVGAALNLTCAALGLVLYRQGVRSGATMSSTPQEEATSAVPFPSFSQPATRPFGDRTFASTPALFSMCSTCGRPGSSSRAHSQFASRTGFENDCKNGWFTPPSGSPIAFVPTG